MKQATFQDLASTLKSNHDHASVRFSIQSCGFWRTCVLQRRRKQPTRLNGDNAQPEIEAISCWEIYHYYYYNGNSICPSCPQVMHVLSIIKHVRSDQSVLDLACLLNLLVLGRVHCTLQSFKKSQIPREPSYVLLNTAISSNWGFPECDKRSCSCDCYSTNDPKCECAVDPKFYSLFPAEFSFDHVSRSRVCPCCVLLILWGFVGGISVNV